MNTELVLADTKLDQDDLFDLFAKGDVDFYVTPDSDQLWAAIAQFQAQLAVIDDKQLVSYTTKTGQKIEYSFVPAKAVWQAIQPRLGELGLAITQHPTIIFEQTTQQHSVSLVSTIGHTSGQYMVSRFTMPVKGNGPQEFGSVVTYIRRYTLMPLLGVFAGDDDDASTGQAITTAITHLTYNELVETAKAKLGNDWLEQLQPGLQKAMKTDDKVNIADISEALAQSVIKKLNGK